MLLILCSKQIFMQLVQVFYYVNFLFLYAISRVMLEGRLNSFKCGAIFKIINILKFNNNYLKLNKDSNFPYNITRMS
jgi:hypothetical protein